ncbi:DUF4259 domain-containing protein [Streptomyces sp. NPDC057950]|uniref:DUF4259 domain-containing protein n=1 Tax=Streptomyces sp. NPDC057950 TaxID=3346288 RepID=UPI0036EDB043
MSSAEVQGGDLSWSAGRFGQRTARTGHCAPSSPRRPSVRPWALSRSRPLPATPTGGTGTRTSPARCVGALSVPGARIRETLRKEISMGTWDIGPFGNDTAADFGNTLDDAEPEACEALVRGVLVRTVVATGCPREADEAVAAAALVAAQCPGGQPVVGTPYGPKRRRSCSLPTFGRSRTKSSPASQAPKQGRPRSGSIRRTGSGARPYSHTFVQCLSRRPPSIALFDVQP